MAQKCKKQFYVLWSCNSADEKNRALSLPTDLPYFVILTEKVCLYFYLFTSMKFSLEFVNYKITHENDNVTNGLFFSESQYCLGTKKQTGKNIIQISCIRRWAKQQLLHWDNIISVHKRSEIMSCIQHETEHCWILLSVKLTEIVCICMDMYPVVERVNSSRWQQNYSASYLMHLTISSRLWTYPQILHFVVALTAKQKLNFAFCVGLYAHIKGLMEKQTSVRCNEMWNWSIYVA